MKPNVSITPNLSITVAIAVLAAAIISAGVSPAGADELSDLRANQAQTNSQIDPRSKPADPDTDGPPTLDSPALNGAPGAGSFPRSFVIPGTDTSVRVGGSIGESIHSH